MLLITDCHSPMLIKFTGEIAKKKVLLAANEEMLTRCSTIPITKKLALAKSILNSKVNIVYNSLEENFLIKIARNDA